MNGPQLAQLACAMARSLTWHQLTGGILAFAGIVALALAILLFARVGQLHGKTFRVYALTDDARGVIRGTEVWLDGQKVGLVKSVDFRQVDVPEKDRLILTLDVVDNALGHVRTDSRTEIRSGGSLIASPVVYVTSGTPRGRPLREGDTLPAQSQLDVESATAQLSEAGQQLPVIMNNVKLLSRQLQSAQSTLGAFGIAGGGATLRTTTNNASRLLTKMSTPRGTIGRIMSGSGPLMTRARHAMGEADSIRALLASGQTTFGRFRRDSSLLREIADVRQELSTLRTLAASSDGTLGRMRQDSAVQNAIAEAYRQMDLLFADVKKHPFRYLAF